MSNYANNMPPSATAGAYSGMGMPSYGPNAEAATNAWANNAPPMYTSPAYTAPAAYPHTMGYSHCVPVKTAPAYVAPCGSGSNTTASILVLFILLVIISRAFLI